MTDTYDTVPDSGNADSSESGTITTYGNNEEMPGVKVQCNGSHAQGPTRVGSALWKTSTLKIYPVDSIPGAVMPSDGVFITGEHIEESFGRRPRAKITDARERGGLPDSLGSDVCWIPVPSSEFEGTHLEEHLVDGWDGGNRQ